MAAVTFARFKAACEESIAVVRRAVVPKDTGNLAYNAIQFEWIGTKFHWWVNEDIAPYMVYTNEPWTSPRWHGKKNPNEGWWERAVELFTRTLAAKLKGEIK